MDTQQPKFNSWPLQPTKKDLDWAVFMYLFIIGVVLGTILLGKIMTVCVERNSTEGSTPAMVAAGAQASRSASSMV